MIFGMLYGIMWKKYDLDYSYVSERPFRWYVGHPVLVTRSCRGFTNFYTLIIDRMDIEDYP